MGARIDEQVCLARTMGAVGALATRVAHDINNLLTGIRGSAGLALMEVPQDSPARADLQEIRELVERATSMSRQLQMLGGNRPTEPQAVDVNELAARARTVLKGLAAAEIDVRLALAERPATIRADPGQIELLLLNLSSNALRALAHGGTLALQPTLTTRAEDLPGLPPWSTPGNYVRLSVSDTGTGMSPETVARIFEPFFTT